MPPPAATPPSEVLRPETDGWMYGSERDVRIQKFDSGAAQAEGRSRAGAYVER